VPAAWVKCIGPPTRSSVASDLPIFRYLTSTAPFVNWDASPAGDGFVFVELEHDESETARIEVALGWVQHTVSTDRSLPNPGE
jgi:hypothetical protein